MIMINIISDIFRYTLTLLFGCFVSASFLNILYIRKNIVILSVFCIFDLALQGILSYMQDISLVTFLYPLIVHLPLLLLLIFVFKKGPVSSVLSLTSAYLCCQIGNWISVMVESLQTPLWMINLAYSIALIITFVFVLYYVTPPISLLLTKPYRSLISFCIIPVSYYVFDYVAACYTELLYTGSAITVEFLPFLLCISYLMFCTVYFKQYEEKQTIENRNRLMQMKQEQSEKEIETMRRSEKNISLLYHNMRHFLSTVSTYIENGENEKAQEYINSIIGSTDKNVSRRYCTNEIVNMILSSYENVIIENSIDFRYTVRIPKVLPFSDVDITSILSNALENAIHAVLPLNLKDRVIELIFIEKNGKILISLANTYAIKPKMADGFPVSENKGHGFGTQSIRYTTDMLKGNCQFSVTDKQFILQIVI